MGGGDFNNVHMFKLCFKWITQLFCVDISPIRVPRLSVALVGCGYSCRDITSNLFVVIWQIWKLTLFFRGRGGVEAEREERERWIDHERRKIQDSVKGQGQPISVCLPFILPSMDIIKDLLIDE